ncbi:MAG: glycosyltransferase family 4 protein [Paludibacter sp.]
MVNEINKKVIWLVNYYAMPPELESRHRTIKFAHYLTEMGYIVKIFSSSFMHNMDKNLILDNSKYIEQKYDDLDFVHINTIGYKKNGLSRFLSLFQFHFKLNKYSREFLKPDIIIHTALPPFGNILYFTARKLKAKYIVEVLDLWPESFVDLGLIKKSNPILAFLFFTEKWLYKKADTIVFSMEGGADYIVDKKWDKNNGGPIDLRKVFYINNGIDLKDFSLFKTLYKLKDAELENDNIKKVIYIGSIRLANNLQELINAAEILKNYSDIKFLLYGDGDDRESLVTFCKERKLENVIFKQKWIEPHFVPYVLSKSTLNILNYKSGSFGKYGGSQSKLFQYLASGIPICSNLKMMYCPINKYNLGIATEFNSAKEYADAILTLVNLDDMSLFELNTRAKKVIIDFDYLVLTKKLVELFK